MPARSRSPRRSPSASTIRSARRKSARSGSTCRAASTPAAITIPAISASSASTRRARSSTRSRSAAAPRTMPPSAASSVPVSAPRRCRKLSTPSSAPTSPSASTERPSSTRGVASALSPSGRLCMALLDLATGELLPAAPEVATLLEPTADAAQLAAAASGNAGPIAIRFPAFGDGRGISLAVLLRERYGFTGEIRAVGYLIPDLAPFLLRSGFDTAEITDANDVETWKGALTRIKHSYQHGFRNPQPLRRDASKREAEELNARLAKIESLSERIAELRRSVEGRIVFSTSLGLDDQAILNAVAESGADVDIFTLDTGRLFPEVLETVELSEIRYRLRIRLVTPEAAEVEALVARDGVFGFRNSVENRKGCCEVRKVRPLNRELKGAQGWIT